MKYSVALSLSENKGLTTNQTLKLVDIDADSHEEALGKAISENWEGGKHLTHYATMLLNGDTLRE